MPSLEIRPDSNKYFFRSGSLEVRLSQTVLDCQLVILLVDNITLFNVI